MPTLVIRNLDEKTHRLLKARAQSAGRSVAEEVRTLLRQQTSTEPAPDDHNWVDDIRAIFEPLGGVELELPSRASTRLMPDFASPERDTYEKNDHP